MLLLGSTGSIGRQSLDVLSGLTDTHTVVGLSACTSAGQLSEQAASYRPEAVCLVREASADALDLPPGCRSLAGAEGLVELVQATTPDLVICAITGAAGLPSTLAAAESGATLALANKESMVLAGHLVKAACRRSGSALIPVDSEHSAIAQCLAGHEPAGVRRLVLTASGGPFRGWTADQLQDVTPEQALKHPSWEMGPRITIDSATLMNKALEIVEACQLFDVPPERVDVIVHPQSVIHSMVEFVDGAILAQLSPPDMRLPIRYALGYPDRLPSGTPPVDLAALSGLAFEEPDRQTFPCLALGEQVARSGGLAGCILNAANEVAVDAFLARRLPFSSIPTVVADALERFENRPSPDLAMLLETDRRVREHAASLIPQFAA
ncbi:MAG: 1-deoxy-D-xylulose-5-phosphate reductoisomerase [Planctomycetota bacterium]